MRSAASTVFLVLHSSRIGRLLIILLAADAAGVALLTSAAVATGGAATVSLAVVAGGSWLLALAGIPSAIRTGTRNAVGTARMRVATGAIVNALGCVAILVAYPSRAVGTVTLLIAGTAVSIVYLLLLARLRPQPATKAHV
jgi:hypothetical protein